MTFNQFVNVILRYESDTFSASGAKLTREKAAKIARRILGSWVECRLDGVKIDAALDHIMSR